MSSPPLICLITSGHVSTTPRLVKNADALAEAGYQVHVVAGAPFPPADALDASILSAAKWGYTRAAYRTGPGATGRKVARVAARWSVASLGVSRTSVLARAHFAGTAFVATAAAKIPADLYLGHCLAALPVAASAARMRGSMYGFDIEDFHDAETEAAIADPVERHLRRALQSRLLPGCRILTSAAPMIASKYKAAYGVESLVVLNVFPLSQAPEPRLSRGPISPGNPVIFYWFSQTVGPDRGLEDAIAVIARMQTPAELHVRGFVSPEYSAALQATGNAHGLERPVRFLNAGEPSQMAALASRADMGLSLELKQPLNRDICLTNKIFVYMLAEIPQLLSNTSAQQMLAPELGEAALLFDPHQPDEAARNLDKFFADDSRVARARQAARDLSHNRYCWDLEKQILLKAVKSLVPNAR